MTEIKSVEVLIVNGEGIDQILTSVTIVAIDTMNDLRDTIVITTSQDLAEEADQETATIATTIQEEDRGHRPMTAGEVKITIIKDEFIF